MRHMSIIECPGEQLLFIFKVAGANTSVSCAMVMTTHVTGFHTKGCSFYEAASHDVDILRNVSRITCSHWHHVL